MTCSLINPPVNAPTLQLCLVGSSGATGLSRTGAANCTDASASVYPVPTGYTCAHASVHPMLLETAEFVHFILSLSSFFVFCFAWPFCFIPEIYNCALDKLISHIDCIVTQSPKSQNNGLMGPCSLHHLQLKCAIDYSFKLHLMLHACVQKFDVTGNLEKIWN